VLTLLAVLFGVNTAAAAAFGEIPALLEPGVILVTVVRGVKEGDSTLRKRLAFSID